MKNLFLFIIATLACQFVKGQLPDYYVFLTHGDVWIQHGNKNDAIKPKQLVYESDVITIRDEHSEIELVNKEGDFVVLNGKGPYKVNSLKGKFSQKTEGLTNKYMRLVWEALTHSSSDFEVYKNESVASSWGGGARGVDCNVEKFPKGSCFFSKDTITFKWNPKDPHNSYRFQLYDNSQSSLIELIVRDTQLVLITRSLQLGEYYWSIDPVSQSCRDIKRNKITLLSKPEEDSMVTSIIKKVPQNKNEIHYNLQISELLGDNGFVEEALEYFNKSWYLYKEK
ncbi:MAG: hypothetical protein ABI416_10805 [Ginsengibacter sp.]